MKMENTFTYHLVFCPRYHRKIFTIDEVEELSKAQNIWTRKYLFSTKAFSQKETDAFVEKRFGYA